MNLSTFLSELKRRKVFRVAVVYAATGFVVLQAADLLAGGLALPGWVFSAITVLVLVGFPVALVLAWALELTPEGVRATRAATTEAGESRAAGVPTLLGRRTLAVSALLVAAGIGLGLGAGRFLGPDAGAAADARAAAEDGVIATAADRSIAVLPFADFSPERDQEWFSDGITDEILTNLAAIGDLRVISRTSVMRYKETTLSLPQIAQELGVAYVLEGTVRRAGNQVRIGAKLVRAAADENLWARNFDRDITDIFAVQTEIARSIADALQAQLTPHEVRVLERRPTDNLDAYDLYLRGNQASQRSGHFGAQLANLRRAIELYSRAIELDPGFASAHARLADTQLYLYIWLYDGSEALRLRGKAALDRALELDPDLALARMVHGDYLLFVAEDAVAAAAEYRRAISLQPSDPESLGRLALVDAYGGRFQQSLARAEQALALDPENPVRLVQAAVAHQHLHDYAAAERLLEGARIRDPGSAFVHMNRAALAIDAAADTARVRRILTEGIHEVGARQLVQTIVQQGQGDLLAWTPGAREVLFELSPAVFGTDSLGIGWLHQVRAAALGRDAAAAEELRKAVSVLAPLLDGETRLRRHDGWIRQTLALVHADLGDAEAALREGRAAYARMAVPGMEGQRALEAIALAQVHARLGQAGPAVELLRANIGRDGAPSRERLRVDPAWDRIRDDPGFQRLLRESAT